MEFIVFKSRPSPGSIAVEVKVPFRELAEQLEERLQRVELYKDLPRGRKRPGWKKQFLATLREAAREMGDVSSEEVLKAVRQYRNENKQRPEVTVEAEPEAARAWCRSGHIGSDFRDLGLQGFLFAREESQC